jgi:hypothetical protein
MHVPLMSFRARFDTHLDVTCGILRVLYLARLVWQLIAKLIIFFQVIAFQHFFINILCLRHYVWFFGK